MNSKKNECSTSLPSNALAAWKIVLVMLLVATSAYAGEYQIQRCAVEIFSAMIESPPMSPVALDGLMQHVSVRELEVDAKLPIAIYEAWWILERPMPHAIFTVEGGKCELIAGDLELLLGETIAEDDFLRFATRSYNAAVERATPPRFETDIGIIEYAASVCSVVHPSTSFSREPGLTLLWNRKDLEKISREVPTGCSETDEVRKVELRKARQQFTEPHILEDIAGKTVVFFSWWNIEGMLWMNEVRLSKEGSVDVRSEVVARHIGDHLNIGTQAAQAVPRQ